jgi:hypothetical protein
MFLSAVVGSSVDLIRLGGKRAILRKNEAEKIVRDQGFDRCGAGDSVSRDDIRSR